MNHISKPFGYNLMANTQHPQYSNYNAKADLAPANEIKSLNNISISERSAVAFTMVQQSISGKFASMQGFNNQVIEPTNEKLNLFDFEEVAKNVMSFVHSSLNAAKSRGASSTELQEMLVQAREGANTGIDEAIEELDNLSILDENLGKGIEKARNLINEGLDKTENELDDAAQARSNIPNSRASHAIDANFSNYLSQANSSDLSITTADGDIVNISFSAFKESQSSRHLSYFSQQDTNGISYQKNSASSSGMNFSFSVEGELDEDELKAIHSLIEDISKIENDFFSGDIDKVFNKAVELGYDEEQLSSFNLELKQSQVSRISQAYSEVANYDVDSNDELNKTVKPVVDFIGDFKGLRDNADKILDKEGKQFNKLLESVLNAEFGHNDELLSQFNKFINKLS